MIDESEAMGDIATMKRGDWRDTGAGVAVGAAAAIESAQSFVIQEVPRGHGVEQLRGRRRL